MGNKRYHCVIPAISKDYLRMHRYYKRLFEYLDVDELVILGPGDLKGLIEKDIDEGIFGDNRVRHVDENDLIRLDDLRPVFNSLLTKENNIMPTAVNWYYQQFLKMAYARMCDSDYYLCWDSDTLPLKKIEMFGEGDRPIFDVKPEFNNTYFITIERLFGFSKIIDKSFVSEHMLFNVALMREMLDEIENTSFEGEKFYEKILSAVGSDNLFQGFSEFETFGSWVGMRHPSAYRLREWKSFRNTNFFIDIEEVKEEDLKWLSMDYDAATFEKYQKTDDELRSLFLDEHYREKLSPKQFYMVIVESGFFGEYSDGAIKENDFNAPL